MLRHEKILRHIDKNGLGLEIGPSHNPIAPKREGYRVHVLDHLSREDLVEKYRDHGVNLDNIEEVDFVWSGQSYRELTATGKAYDWIIASHVIEHTPDLIGFLKDCDTILRDDGILSLAVPDKRFCFDHFRPVSGIAKVIDNHLQKSSIHTAGTVAECYLNTVTKGGHIGWDQTLVGDYAISRSTDQARHTMEDVTRHQRYVDVHAWCFVPHSFRLMMQDLFDLGFSPFKEVDFFPTAGSEFFMTLSRRGTGLTQSRLEILNTIESEIASRDRPTRPHYKKQRKSLTQRLKQLFT